MDNSTESVNIFLNSTSSTPRINNDNQTQLPTIVNFTPTSSPPSQSIQFQLLTALANNFLPPFYVGVAVGVPSAILYSMELVVMAKYRKGEFESTFYNICALRAISSLFGYVASYLNARLPKIGVRELIGFYNALPRFLLNIIYFFHFYPYHLDNVATAILLFNRLTAILLPTKYELLWRKYNLLVLLLTILLPLPFTGHIFTLDIFLHFEQDNNGNTTFTLDYRDKPNKPINATIGAWSAVIFMCVCLALNIVCLVAYRLSSQLSQYALEAQLTKFTVLTFLGQLLMAIYYVLIHLAVRMSINGFDLPFLAIYNQYPWIYDFGTIVAPAWIFLWTCTPMRTRVLTMLPFKLGRRIEPVSDGTT